MCLHQYAFLCFSPFVSFSCSVVFSYSYLFLFIYLVIFCIIINPWVPVCFWKRKVVDMNERGGEKELEGEERGKTVIRIYCVKKLYSMK